MSSFLDLVAVRVPRMLAEETHIYLRRIGETGNEAVALWAGETQGNMFHVRHSIVPKQTPVASQEGLCYFVSGEELHRINLWLFKNSFRLVAQVHSHPREAYHSQTDDRYAMVSTSGGLSLVVPDFAVAPFNLDEYAVYRLVPEHGWVEMSGVERKRFIVIED